MGKVREVIVEGDNTVNVQGEIAGFEQKRIPAIERAALKHAEKQALANGLKEEVRTQEFKVREAMRANADSLDQQDDGEGGKVLVYKRGTFEIVCKTKETVKIDVGQAKPEDSQQQPKESAE